MKKELFSEETFLVAIKNMLQSSSGAEISEREILQLLEEYNLQTDFSTPFPTVICLLDFKNETYAHISENVIDIFGDLPSEFLTKGFAHSLRYFPENHRKIFIEEILPTITDLLESHTTSKTTKSLLFSYTTKLNVYGNQSKWFLHQLSVIKTHEDIPIIALKIINDIDEIKKDEQIDFIVSKKNGDGHSNLLLKKSFNVFKPNLNLSIREKEILKLIANGFSSESIAHQLNISKNTVNNHRKNMLNKTQSRNSQNLIKSAMSQNLI